MLTRALATILLAAGILGSGFAMAQASRKNRDDRTILIYADPVAFSPYYGYGLNAGLLLTADLAVEAGYTRGASCLDDSCQFETRLSEARIKWFLGNSFFLNLGVGSEQATWDHGIFWGRRESNASFKAEVTTTGGVFALGNMWQHGGFTIGCDWFGLYVPTAITAFEFTEGEGYTQASREDDESDARTRALGTHFLGLRLHLGVAL